MALHALSRMETRKYHSETTESSSSSEENRNLSDAESTLSTQLESTNAKCVICLEKFKNGQVRFLAFSFIFLFCRYIVHRESFHFTSVEKLKPKHLQIQANYHFQPPMSQQNPQSNLLVFTNQLGEKVKPFTPI